MSRWIPNEIKRMIVDHVDGPDLPNLARSCREFRAEALLELENYKATRRAWVRLRHRFTDSHDKRHQQRVIAALSHILVAVHSNLDLRSWVRTLRFDSGLWSSIDSSIRYSPLWTALINNELLSVLQACLPGPYDDLVQKLKEHDPKSEDSWTESLMAVMLRIFYRVETVSVPHNALWNGVVYKSMKGTVEAAKATVLGPIPWSHVTNLTLHRSAEGPDEVDPLVLDVLYLPQLRHLQLSGINISDSAMRLPCGKKESPSVGLKTLTVWNGNVSARAMRHILKRSRKLVEFQNSTYSRASVASNIVSLEGSLGSNISKLTLRRSMVGRSSTKKGVCDTLRAFVNLRRLEIELDWIAHKRDTKQNTLGKLLPPSIQILILTDQTGFHLHVDSLVQLFRRFRTKPVPRLELIRLNIFQHGIFDHRHHSSLPYLRKVADGLRSGLNKQNGTSRFLKPNPTGAYNCNIIVQNAKCKNGLVIACTDGEHHKR